MNHQGRLIIFAACYTSIAIADCIPVSTKQKNKFICNGESVNVDCEDALSCELNLNRQLAKYGFIYENKSLKQIKKIAMDTGQVDRCEKRLNNDFECLKNNQCKNHIFFDKINFKPESSKICPASSESGFQKVGATYSGAKPSSFLQFSPAEKVKEGCPTLGKNDQMSLSLNFDKLFQTITDGTFKSCFNYAKDFSSKEKLTDTQKTSLTIALSDLIQKDLQSNQLNCDKKLPPLFKDGKLDFDHYLCVKIQESQPVLDVKCSSQDSESTATPISSSQTNANQASAKTAANRLPDASEVIKIPSSPEITNPVQVKETLAQIDALPKNPDGSFTPESATKAGKLFETGIYTAVKSAADYVDRNVSSRTPSSVPSPSSSSGKTITTIGRSSKSDITKLSGKTVAGNLAESTGGGGSIATDDLEQKPITDAKNSVGYSKSSTLATSAVATTLNKQLPAKNPSSKNHNLMQTGTKDGSSGAGTKGSTSTGSSSSAAASLTNVADGVSSDQSSKVVDLTKINSIDDLKSQIKNPKLASQLDELLTTSNKSNIRAPANSANLPLLQKLEQMHIKLVDTTTGAVIAPKQFDYVLQKTPQGYFLINKIRAVKK